MKVAFYTLGCKVNQAEINSLQKILVKDYGGELVNQKADICIVNVCSVTVKAEKESRQTLRLARQQHPDALLIATGCWQKRNVSQVDWWIDNQQKELMPDLLKQKKIITAVSNKKNEQQKIEAIQTGGLTTSSLIKGYGRQRNLKQRIPIKIQDGCNNACAFCISRLLRGKSKSRSVNEIIKEIITAQQEGCQEIILVGINLSLWKEKNHRLYVR